MGKPLGLNRKAFGLWVSLAFASFGTISCSLTQPELVVNDLPPLELDSDSVLFKGRNLRATSIALKGKAHNLVESLQLSFDGGKTWVDPVILTASTGVSVSRSPASCTDCPFSMTVAQIGQMDTAFANTAFGQKAKVLVRGTGKFGNTSPAAFEVWRTNYISYGVFNAGHRGGKIASLTSGYKVRGAQVFAHGRPTVATGSFGYSRGGVQ